MPVCLIHKLTMGFAVVGVINGVLMQETFKVGHFYPDRAAHTIHGTGYRWSYNPYINGLVCVYLYNIYIYIYDG